MSVSALLDFPALYAAHHTKVRRIVGLILRGDPAAVDDVTQNVWLKAWRGREKFRGDCAPATWLHRIAVNETLMWLREGRRTPPTDSLDEIYERVEGRVDWAEELPRALRRRDGVLEATPERLDLARAVSHLPPSLRVIFRVNLVEGRTYGEVAEVTGRTRGGAKMAAFGVRRRLRWGMKGGAGK